MTTHVRRHRRPLKRWLVAAVIAAAAVIMYRLVVPRALAVYTHPEKLQDSIEPK